jgi:hypothetical protein
MDMAAAMGIALLTEEQYRQLQQLEAFDTKTSSWIVTPVIFENAAVRFSLTGAMAMCLSITTARPRTMQPGDSAVRCGSSRDRTNRSLRSMCGGHSP